MTATTRPIEEAAFDLAPISMWIEDFSGVRALFDQWRAEGVTDIRAFLEADLSRVAACSRSIKVLRVNARTLALYEARDLAHLTENLERVFRDDMLQSHVNELSQLWAGEQTFSSLAVNYTLGGRRLDIQLRGAVLPGSEQSLDRILPDLRGCDRPRRGAQARTREPALRRGHLRIFADLALGRGFQPDPPASRKSARARDRGSAGLHRRPPRVRPAMHGRDPGDRREPGHARHVLRPRQAHASQPSARHLPRQHGAAFPRAADRALEPSLLPQPRGW